MSQDVKQVYSRMPDDENGGFLKFPACLINETLAFVVFDEQLEVHILQPTTDANEYELRYASNPMFQVGNNFGKVFDDLQKMNLVEFAKKYTHSDFAPPEFMLPHYKQTEQD